MTLDDYPKMNSQGFRILDTSESITLSKGANAILMNNAVAQFMYRGYEISFCSSSLFEKVFTAVLLDDDIVYNCDTLEQGIDWINSKKR